MMAGTSTRQIEHCDAALADAETSIGDATTNLDKALGHVHEGHVRLALAELIAGVHDLAQAIDAVSRAELNVAALPVESANAEGGS